MNNKTKLLALLMILAMAFSTLAPTMVLAADADRTIIAQETFDDKALNNKNDTASVVASGGFWFGDNNGSTYTLEGGTLKYTNRNSKDITDIRFWQDKTAQAWQRELVSGDFTLSFRIKPLDPCLDMWINWTERDLIVAYDAFSAEEKKAVKSPYEDGVKLSAGILSGRATTDRRVAEVPLNQWSVIEIYFNYDESAMAFRYDTQEPQTGAFTSYTVRLNGKDLGTAELGTANSIKNAFHCIDFIRLFQGATGRYELDDLTVISGAEPYNTNWDQTQEEYYATHKIFYTEKAPATNYAYSLAVVGDTQIVCQNDALYNQNGMDTIYQWIVDNKASKKIEYVLGVGDITQSGNNTAEWNIAKNAISKLNGVVPYSLPRGNHDGTQGLNNSFNNDAYKSQFDGFYDDRVENAYKLMTIGGTKYLFIALDYGPEDAVLEWAGDLCEAYPDHKVIITTHAYLYADGTTIDIEDVCDPITMNNRENNGETMWNKLGRKYENIFMIISGHISSDRVVVTEAEGDNGNIVTQMLVDFQSVDSDYGYGSVGIVTMLYFSEDGKQVEVEAYSPIKQAYFREENQFTFNVDKKTIVNHNFDDVTINTSSGYGSFGTVANNGGFAVQTQNLATASTETDQLILSGMRGGSFVDLQLYNCGFSNTGSNPINRDFVLSFDLKIDSLTDTYGGISIRDNAEKRNVPGKGSQDVWANNIVTVGGGKIAAGGKSANLTTDRMYHIEVVFNYNPDKANYTAESTPTNPVLDGTTGAFSTYTVLVDGVELTTATLPTTVSYNSTVDGVTTTYTYHANLKYINHFRLFHCWGAASSAGVSFTLDNLYVGYGKGNRGAEFGTVYHQVDFKDMPDVPTSDAHYGSGFKLFNTLKPAAGGKSYLSNDIVYVRGGATTGQTFVDLNLGQNDAKKPLAGGDFTVSMLIRPYGNMSSSSSIAGNSVVEVTYNASKDVNTIKIKGASTGAELSNYRFSNVEFMIHYDYAKMAYTGMSLHVNGEFVGSASFVTPTAQITLFRLFEAWSWNSSRGFDVDEVTIVTGNRTTYKGETSVTDFIGYQASTADADNFYDVRLLAVMTDANVENYENVGFKVQIKLADGTLVTMPEADGVCKEVYSAVKATAGIDKTYTAEELGGKAIFALNCTKISTTYGAVTFTVTTYYTLAGQDSVNERTFVFTVDPTTDLPQTEVN